MLAVQTGLKCAHQHEKRGQGGIGLLANANLAPPADPRTTVHISNLAVRAGAAAELNGTGVHGSGPGWGRRGARDFAKDQVPVRVGKSERPQLVPTRLLPNTLVPFS